MRQKILFLLITSSVALGLLAGCSGGDSSTKKDINTGQTQKSTVSVTSSAAPASSPDMATQSTQASALTVEQKLEDFEYMWSILTENYPFFEVNKRMNGEDWLSNRENYRNEIAATSTDTQFYRSMESVLARLNNDHTVMLDSSFHAFFSENFADDIPRYEPWFNVLQQPHVLARYNQEPTPKRIVEDNESVDVKDKSKGIKRVSGNVKKEIIEQDQTAYLALKSLAGEYIDMDSVEIRDFLVKVKNYKTLIIDIRGNGGGYTTYWRFHIVPLLINDSLTYTTFLLYRGGEYGDAFFKAHNLTPSPIADIKNEQLANLPPEATTMFKSYSKSIDSVQPYNSVGFKGEIYLIVDKDVYSAAEGFAAFAKGTGFATVVGERTGGDGVGIDPLLAALPNSGYVFKFSSVMGLNSDGSCNEEVKTIPDVVVDPDTSKPLLEQPAIQKVLELASSH